MSNMSQIFEPNEEQKRRMPDFVNNKVPRFLFRVQAPGSAGTVNTEYARPTGTEEKGDIFKYRPRAAAGKVRKHLQGGCTKYSRCNFVSWTSSLLWALMWGFYRAWDESAGEDLSSVRLFVIDTLEFPAGTFIQDLEIIEVFHTYERYPFRKGSLTSLRNLRTNGYYFGEYLTQGDLRIQGKCVQTTLEKLRSRGLFKLNIGLEDKRTWYKPNHNILALRKAFELFKPYRRAGPIERTEVRKAIAIAETCFGGPWTALIALHLLAFRPSGDPGEAIVNEFDAIFTCTIHINFFTISLSGH